MYDNFIGDCLFVENIKNKVSASMKSLTRSENPSCNPLQEAWFGRECIRWIRFWIMDLLKPDPALLSTDPIRIRTCNLKSRNLACQDRNVILTIFSFIQGSSENRKDFFLFYCGSEMIFFSEIMEKCSFIQRRTWSMVPGNEKFKFMAVIYHLVIQS